MPFFITAVALFLLAAVAGIFCRRGSRFWARLAELFMLAGCLLGLVATVQALLAPDQAFLHLPWSLPGGALALKIDALAALFLLPALLIAAVGSLYGAGYRPVEKGPTSAAWLRIFYPLLAGSIMVLLAADNAILFLLAWEIMTLAGYFLVVTDRQDSETLRAGYIYLAATHTGTLALFALFALLMEAGGPEGLLPRAASLAGHGPQATLIFLLALFGFGLKAGIMPLHIWLPGAHAAAPSHVSALMSGVMIKMGIYGIMRTTGYFTAIPAWWGWTVLCLGLISAIFGVVFAIAQHDIKRLLAYHSVENIGIILLGLGCALLGRSHGVAAMVTLGMAAALLHVVNHGLFKALLFLSAGSLIQATGSRLLSRYGGLLRTMPFTALFFLGGAVAICGLPPLNGFVSEWLLYLGLFEACRPEAPTLAVLAMPGLAMTGGLALLCFTKVFGLTFLGSPRAGLGSGEAPASMLGAMAILLAACLWIGLAPASLLPLLAGATATWLGSPATDQTDLLTGLAPAGQLSLMALLLVAIAATIFLVGRLRRPAPVGPRPVTWGCGHDLAIPRGQYSAASFAQIIVSLFHWVLQTNTSQQLDRQLFPAAGKHQSHTPDTVLDLLLVPLSRRLAQAAVLLRRLVQHGVLGLYLLYFALTLAALLLFSFW